MIFALALALAVQEPVRVELNHDQYSAGDKARVYVRSAQDGYLVVLHADPAGRVRVLFPVDPSDDDFIRAGKKFEVRSRNNREGFQVEGTEGSGLVFAAVSTDPFKFDDFTRNDHWDYRALGGPSTAVKDDPLATLADIVQRMSGDSEAGGRFEYDQVTYVVRPYRFAGYDYYGYGSHYPRFGIRFGFGYPFYSAFYDPFCDPFWGCYGGWGRGYPYSYGYFYRPIYRYRPVVFGGFGTRFTRTPQFVFPKNRALITPTPVRTRTIVPVDTRSRSLEPRMSPSPRSSGRPQFAPERGRGSSPRGTSSPRAGSSGGSRSSGGGAHGARPSNSGRGGGGGRRH